MAQNFKRRISLYPDHSNIFKNSLNRLKEQDISLKADLDTFNKTSIYKNTPKKEKKLNKDLLETPILEKEKYRKISIYSPISFGDLSTPASNNDTINKKIITDFNSQILLSEDNFDFKDFNRIFHLRKYKKKEINQNIISRNIVLSNDRNENFIIPLYNDIDIYGKNNFIRSSFQNEYNSNAKDIKNKKNLYLINLEEGINHIKKFPDYISKIISRKKCI